MTGQHGFRNNVNWPIGLFTPAGTPSQLDVDMGLDMTNPNLLPLMLRNAG